MNKCEHPYYEYFSRSSTEEFYAFVDTNNLIPTDYLRLLIHEIYRLESKLSWQNGTLYSWVLIIAKTVCSSLKEKNASMYHNGNMWNKEEINTGSSKKKSKDSYPPCYSKLWIS